MSRFDQVDNGLEVVRPDDCVLAGPQPLEEGQRGLLDGRHPDRLHRVGSIVFAPRIPAEAVDPLVELHRGGPVAIKTVLVGLVDRAHQADQFCAHSERDLTPAARRGDHADVDSTEASLPHGLAEAVAVVVICQVGAWRATGATGAGVPTEKTAEEAYSC